MQVFIAPTFSPVQDPALFPSAGHSLHRILFPPSTDFASSFFLLTTLQFCFSSWVEDTERSVFRNPGFPIFFPFLSSSVSKPQWQLASNALCKWAGSGRKQHFFSWSVRVLRKPKRSEIMPLLQKPKGIILFEGLIPWLWGPGGYIHNRRNLATMSVISLIQPYLVICELRSILIVLARHRGGEGCLHQLLRATTWPKLGKAWALAAEKDNLGTSFLELSKGSRKIAFTEQS